MSVTLFEIGSDNLRAKVAPDFGGVLSTFEFRKGDQWFPLFQPADSEELVRAGKKAYFVMGPTTARTRHGAFPFHGEMFSLGDLGHPHAIHGFLPKSKFAVVSSTPSRISLELAQKDQPFPYPGDFLVRLDYSIGKDGLIIDFKVENRGNESVPWGGGSHPMILKNVMGSSNSFLLKFNSQTHFEADPSEPENYLPTGKVESVPGTPLDYSVPKPGAMGRDSTYGGWDGVFEADWQEVGVRLVGGVIKGNSTLLHYWNHPDRSIWACEQLACVADAHNLAARGIQNTGLQWVMPGETFEWTHYFNVHLR